MEKSSVLKRIKKSTGGAVQVLFAEAQSGFKDIQQRLDFFGCSFDEFLSQSHSIEEWQALLLLSATCHKTLAYQVKIMGLNSARQLATDFVESLGESVEYYSNCFCDDDSAGVGSWNPVTKHTFESILYCKTQSSDILVVCVDED